MELILKLQNGDLSPDESLALAEQSRAEGIAPGDLAARYLRDGMVPKLTNVGIHPEVRRDDETKPRA
jgi:hypothetical protein